MTKEEIIKRIEEGQPIWGYMYGAILSRDQDDHVTPFEIIKIRTELLDIYEDHLFFIYGGPGPDWCYFYYADYGKTWAFSKEEIWTSDNCESDCPNLEVEETCISHVALKDGPATVCLYKCKNRDSCEELRKRRALTEVEG